MSTDPITILLIEDNPGDVGLIRTHLAAGQHVTPYRLEHVDRVASGLERLKQGDIDVILLDLSLPDGQGLETFTTMYAHSPHVPIIVLTGLADEELADYAVRQGAQDYIAKGQIDGTLLTRAIRYAIERKRAEDERQSLEVQLRQAQKMEALGALAGGIAHDFNNILAAMVGYTELALFDLSPDSPLRSYLHEVLTAGKRAKSLIQQILAFSRQRDLELQPLQLRLVVREVVRLMRASLPATIELREKLDRNAGMVLASATQVHQVVLNLCTNAEQAMRTTGGVLEVRLEAVEVPTAITIAHADLKPGAYVRLSVRDTGPGIPLEVQERIFEPFYTTKGPGEGTGMGLAVAHGIVASHGGAIAVESAPGQGATFAVYFPRLDDTATEEQPEDDAAAPRGSGERILFVDDEVPLTELGRDMLVQLGYDVVVRTSSREALEAFRSTPYRFDLVITDQTMPQMTGEALAQEMRRLRPAIPIILCTGFSHLINEEKARAAGIDAFCMKPLIMHDLAHTIRTVLSSRTPQQPPSDSRLDQSQA
jgi:signal transduction histidine kinase